MLTSMSQSNKLNIFSLISLVVATVWLNYTFVQVARDLYHVRSDPIWSSRKSYSYIGADHPTYLPVEQRKVRMRVEESVHYGVDSDESSDEWLWTAPIGDNHCRLGDRYRMFAVAQFHQLHCLRGIRRAMEIGWNSMGPHARGHLHHCFNYLRQWTLCDADMTLEQGDFAKRNFTEERYGATHVCRDWEPTYELMTTNWRNWDSFRREQNLVASNEEQ